MVYNITNFATSELFRQILHHEQMIIVGINLTKRPFSKTVKMLLGTYVTLATIFYYFYKTVISSPRKLKFNIYKDNVYWYMYKWVLHKKKQAWLQQKVQL